MSWLGIVICSAVLAVVIWEGAKHLRYRTRRRWKTVGGAFPFMYDSTDPIDEDKLISNVDMAYASLLTQGPWNRRQLWAAFTRARIFVATHEAWDQVVCTMKTGETPTVIAVGKSMSSLCHEMAHLAEALIDGAVDLQHLGWARRGIAGATGTYERTRRL